MTALHERQLPASFVYAFDEAWAIGDRLRRRISRAVQHDYALVEDVWGFLVPPGTAGWPAHRGISDVVLDRAAPEILNVWVALTDVTVDRACMHAVPLPEDPRYPASLASVDTAVAPHAAITAMPVDAGDALLWNANVLHWGGRCSPSAAGARASCSFTLLRADAAAKFPEMKLLRPLEQLDLQARMDVLARMVLVYGDPERGDVAEGVREWAVLTLALATRFRVSERT
jgi:ectoine hydroxylase-related dioxygenase (phytanoyl-CoA dioxygenase family)